MRTRSNRNQLPTVSDKRTFSGIRNLCPLKYQARTIDESPSDDDVNVSELIDMFEGTNLHIPPEEMRNYFHVNDEDSPEIIGEIKRDAKEAVAKSGINLLSREEASDTDVPNDASDESHATANEESEHEDVTFVGLEKLHVLLAELGIQFNSEKMEKLSGDHYARLLRAYGSLSHELRDIMTMRSLECLKKARQTIIYENTTGDKVQL